MQIVILDNDGAGCHAGDASASLESFPEFKYSPNGFIGVRGLVNRNIEVSEEMYGGQYAALVSDGAISACCEIEVIECRPPYSSRELNSLIPYD